MIPRQSLLNLVSLLSIVVGGFDAESSPALAAERGASTSPATTRPVTDTAATAMARQLLANKGHRSPEYYEALRDLAALGEPAELIVLNEAVMEDTWTHPRFKIVIEEWKRQRLCLSQRHRDEALKLVPKIVSRPELASVELLDVYGRLPELTPVYATLITDHLPYAHWNSMRYLALERLMELDPSGKIAIDAVKKAMIAPSPGELFWCYDLLRRIGESAIPLLIELSHVPDLDTRTHVLRSMQPFSGTPFRPAVADRAVDIYLDPASDLGAGSDRYGNPAQLQKTVLATLESMGTEGAAIAAQLRDGQRPVSASRRRFMEELEASEALKVILFTKDPSRSVSEAQWTVIQRLAKLYKRSSRAAIEEAFHVVNAHRDDGEGVIAIRLLDGLPEVGSRSDDLPRLIDAAQTLNPLTRLALAPPLLDGRFKYGKEI